MKKALLFVVLLAGVVFVQAQSVKLSPRTAMLVHEIRQGQCTEDVVFAFATLSAGVDIKALDVYGVKVNSVVGNQLTVAIPTKRMEEFVASGLCSYIDIGHKVKPLLDRVRAELGVDYIHQGINLP